MEYTGKRGGLPRCPYCNEVVQANKKYCPSCGELLQAPSMMNPPASPPPAGIQGQGWQPSPFDASGQAMHNAASQQQAVRQQPPGKASLRADFAPAYFEGKVSRRRESTEYDRGEDRNLTIRTFRVTRYDSSGNAMPPIQVKMRGDTFYGDVEDGDSVRIPVEWRDGEVITTNQIYNITTASPVRARLSTPGCLQRTVYAIVGLGFSAGAFSMLVRTHPPQSGAVMLTIFVILGLVIAIAGLLGKVRPQK